MLKNVEILNKMTEYREKVNSEYLIEMHTAYLMRVDNYVDEIVRFCKENNISISDCDVYDLADFSMSKIHSSCSGLIRLYLGRKGHRIKRDHEVMDDVGI